jgi:hypothetical protein
MLHVRTLAARPSRRQPASPPVQLILKPQLTTSSERRLRADLNPMLTSPEWHGSRLENGRPREWTCRFEPCRQRLMGRWPSWSRHLALNEEIAGSTLARPVTFTLRHD